MLFIGPQGTGKRLTATELAKALNCETHPSKGTDSCDRCSACERIGKKIYPDVCWINFETQASLMEASPEKQINLRIETVRSIQKELGRKSLEGRWKAAIVEPAELLTQEASNAMLKLLEEPPPKTLLILLSTQLEGVLPTLRSRCQTFRFNPLPESVVEQILQERMGMPHGESRLWARMAEGSVAYAILCKEISQMDSLPETAKPLEILNWIEGWSGPSTDKRERAESWLKYRLLETWHEWRKNRSQHEAPRQIRELLTALRHIRQNAHIPLVMETTRLSKLRDGLP